MCVNVCVCVYAEPPLTPPYSRFDDSFVGKWEGGEKIAVIGQKTTGHESGKRTHIYIYTLATHKTLNRTLTHIQTPTHTHTQRNTLLIYIPGP